MHSLKQVVLFLPTLHVKENRNAWLGGYWLGLRNVLSTTLFLPKDHARMVMLLVFVSCTIPGTSGIL